MQLLLIDVRIFSMILSCAWLIFCWFLIVFLMRGTLGTHFDRFWRFLPDLLLFWFITGNFLIDLCLEKDTRTYITWGAALRPCVTLVGSSPNRCVFVYCSRSQKMMDSGSNSPNTCIPGQLLLGKILDQGVTPKSDICLGSCSLTNAGFGK